MPAGRGSAWGWRPAGPRLIHVVVGLRFTAFALSARGGGNHGGAASSDPAVRQARATVGAPPPPVSAYRGPSSGPRAQPPAPVVFVAADATDEGIATVARAVQQAATAIGWPLQILDGQADVQIESQEIRMALRERPGGIILGGVDAADQQAALREPQAQRIPVVGWHAAPTPGPDPRAGLFTNVTSDPAQVARLAADYAIADSGGTAGAVIFTDPAYAIDTYTSDLMASNIRRCRDCSVLAVLGVPVVSA
jgi:ribose transport system substrate-binding protein